MSNKEEKIIEALGVENEYQDEKESKSLTKTDKGYKWQQNYEVTLTEQQYERNKSNLQKNIAGIKAILKDKPEVKVSIKNKQLEEEYKIIEHSLRNYEEYVDVELAKLRETMLSNKEALQSKVNNKEDNIKIELQKYSETVKKDYENALMLLKDQEDKYEYYKEVEVKNNK